MNNNTQITLSQQPADSISFSHALQGLTQNLMNAAAENIDTAIAGSDYTALERRSMIAIEALRLTSGMDLAAILTRGTIISQIETEGLVSVHPNQYRDLTEMAKEQGISVSELSDTKAMCEVIFPYIVDGLGMSLAETWTSVGKSAMREMVPALRSIITGQAATHTSVRTAVEAMLNQAAAQIAANNGDPSDVEVVRAEAVRSLMHSGATLPARQLRQQIRPTRTANVPALTMVNEDGSRFMVLKIDAQDQFDMVVRLLGTHADNMTVASTPAHTNTFNRLFGA